MVQLFIKEGMRLHNILASIILDRGQAFISQFLTKLFQAQSTILQQTSAYHPQSDKQTKVVN